jgi:D-serine deaminase-like pyridoxal phosphate-dependent protein
MTFLTDLQTPAALVDVETLQRNISRMQRHVDKLGLRFRPHVKTTKCMHVVSAQLQAGAHGITVSTLREAEHFFDHGIRDILYAVGIAPAKLRQASVLRQRGCDLKLIADNLATAYALAAFRKDHGQTFEVWLEVDTDGHRSGIAPDAEELLKVAHALRNGGHSVTGVLTHAGSSYGLSDPAALHALAERERAGAAEAAERLRRAGVACPHVSIGSTPTALALSRADGITEVRAGVYAFFDLVMHNVGVCSPDDIALSVLTTVIGHQPAKGWAIVDAGWMAMSRDRGTQSQSRDFGYGLVCSEAGDVLSDYVVSSANQEHGIVSRIGGTDDDIVKRLPIGSRLRVLPNHACATGAQHADYRAVAADGSTTVWPRLSGW